MKKNKSQSPAEKEFADLARASISRRLGIPVETDFDDGYEIFDEYPSDMPLDFTEHPNIAEEIRDEEEVEDD